MNESHDLEERWWSTSLNRRTLLRGSVLGGAGLAAAALIGCGDDDDDDDDVVATATTAPDEEEPDEDDDEEEPEEVVASGDLPYPIELEELGGTPKSGGVLKVAHTITVSVIDPIVSAAGGTITVPNVVYDRLVGFKSGFGVSNTQLEVRSELADAWELSEDGLQLTFTLRDDVKWQNVDPLNGRAFTSADAKFALERFASETSVHRSLVRKIASIDTPDDQTLVMNLSEPWPDALVTLSTRFMTMHPQELVDNETIERNAIGTGPMILSDLADDRAVFERNPDYWRSDVLLDGMEILSVPDKAARLARFRVGQVDWAISLIGNKQDAEQLLETNPEMRILITLPYHGTFTIGMNLSNPKYADERIRRALSLGMDREFIKDVVYDGLGFSLPMPPFTYFYDDPPAVEDLPYYNFDPEEAKKLLAAAGAEGLEMDFIYYNYSPTSNSQQNEIIQQNYSDLGLNFNAQAVDYTEFNSQWIPGDYADAADGWGPTGSQADNWWFDHLHSESPANRWHLSDSQIDEWAEAQTVEIDEAARTEIWKQMWDRLLDQAYRPTKPTGVTMEAYPPYLRGVRFGGALGANSTYYDWGEQIANAWLDK